jgi:2,3-bisphosphoglycerate-dependent phosphoglycerate mutase
MKNLLLFAIVCLFFISCSRTVYVVRHAEKVASTDSIARMMTNDPPLSEAGKVRAIVLKDELDNKHISHIYSTNTIRTMSTVGPLSQAIKISVDPYSNIDSLVNLIKSTKGNALVVGHSNTVDDIVNKLCGQTKIAADLKDGEYDNLFIVKFRGKKAIFERRKYGYPSNP